MTITPRTSRRYGYIPSLPDHRDLKYGAVRRAVAAPLPSSVDLRPQCSPVRDQGNASSCTGNALAAAVEFLDLKEQITPADPLSRLFIYYNERVIENIVAQDGGAMIRDGIKSLAAQGVCSEDSWPYDLTALTDEPPPECYTEALLHQTAAYARLDTLDEMRACLADGYPIIAGFSVFKSFESDAVAQTGIVPMPGDNEALVGGHCILLVGYDDATEMLCFKNSWGIEWGEHGFGFLPYGFATSGLISEAWSIRREANF